MIRSFWMKFIFFMVVLVLTITLHGQPTLKWGADPSGGAPHVFVNPAQPNSYTGFETEFVEALAQKMGYLPKLIPTQWDSLVPCLQRGDYDIIVNGLEATTDRLDYILISKPYYLYQLQLTVTKDSSISHLNEAKHITVGTLGNTAAERILQQYTHLTSKQYSDPVSPYHDLAAGRIDAVLADAPIELYYGRSNLNFKPAGSPSYTGAYVVGIRKNDSILVDKINAAIDALIEEGTVEKILKKWNLWNPLQFQLKEGQPPLDLPSPPFNWKEALGRLGKAACVTALIAFGAMILALILGVTLALLQMKGPRWVRLICSLYIEFFRGTPLIVQLLFLYFGLPILGITLPGWLTALVGLGLNYASYESQVYNAAFEAIPKGQWEVASSLGMSPVQCFRRIIFPQAFRIALPPMTNDFVSLFKDTSVAFAISVWELATAYRELANASQYFFALGLITSLFYLAMSVPLAHYARYLERSLNSNRSRKKYLSSLVLETSQ